MLKACSSFNANESVVHHTIKAFLKKKSMINFSSDNAFSPIDQFEVMKQDTIKTNNSKTLGNYCSATESDKLNTKTQRYHHSQIRSSKAFSAREENRKTYNASFLNRKSEKEKVSNLVKEERKLVLTSVKNVDCQDFPFDAVLSLEDTVNNIATEKKEMRHCRPTAKRARQHSEGTITAVVAHQDVFKENIQSFQVKQASQSKTESVGKSRPPLLKCSTWPQSDAGECTDESSKKFSNSANDVEVSSKLDSPSFYSSSAIDFSAISHLSEEHDKLMALEKEEKNDKHAYISSTTKEKIFGKASQRNTASGGKKRKDSKDTNKETSYTISSMAIKGITSEQPHMSVTIKQPDVESGISSNATVTRKSIREIPLKKVNKSITSTFEKTVRKRYSSTSCVTVSSTPFSSLQRDKQMSPVIVESQHSPSQDDTSAEANDGIKKHLNVPVEKQPLPPEGFKISRYPLSRKATTSNQPISPEACDQNSSGEDDLHRIILCLRKQLQQAECKINEAERRAHQWKEKTQQALRIAHIVKAQLIREKAKTNQIEISTEGMRRAIPRRWSDEERQIYKLSTENNRSRVVSADNMPERELSSSGIKNVAKRRWPFENDQNKKQGISALEKSNAKSLLEWLTDTGPGDEEVDYMNFIETTAGELTVGGENAPKNFSVVSIENLPSATQRSMSHNEVRMALRAKVGGSNSDLSCEETADEVQPNFPQKSPLKDEASFDCFLNSFAPSDIEMRDLAETANVVEQQKQSLLLTPSQASSPESSHSDSEQTQDTRSLPHTQYNTGSNLLANFTDTESNEVDFLNQLDSILCENLF